MTREELREWACMYTSPKRCKCVSCSVNKKRAAAILTLLDEHEIMRKALDDAAETLFQAAASLCDKEAMYRCGKRVRAALAATAETQENT